MFKHVTNINKCLLFIFIIFPAYAIAEGSASLSDTWEFTDTSELNDFDLHSTTTNDLQDGLLFLKDDQSGDAYIGADDDSGILGKKRYSGGLDVILKYSDHALLATGYQAILGLFLADDSYAWESPATNPSLTAKIYDSINYSWLEFADNAGQFTQVALTPRKTSGYLRLLRQNDAVTAWYWHNDSWQQMNDATISYAGDIRVGVRMYANYQDLYSVKLESLTINTDQDSDGISDELENLLGTDPHSADTDNDNIPDGSDLWPVDNSHTEKTRAKSQSGITVQLFRVAGSWSLLVTSHSAESITPRVSFSGLPANTHIDVPASNRNFQTTDADVFIDTEVLLAFSSRLYQFDASAYTAPDPDAPIYPSTLTAWTLTGGQQTPTDVDTQAVLSDADAVTDWELTHADVVFGGGFGARNDEMKAAVGYMYNQILGFNPGQREMWLRDQAESKGINYEDFLLHFSEDTTVEVRNTSNSIYTPLYGVPTVTGYTRSATDTGVLLYEQSPFDVGAWDNASDDGALYVYLFEPFDRLNIQLSTVANNGELIIEYPSAVDDKGFVSEWQSLNKEDGTQNLSQNGTVSWVPPNNWKRAATYDPSSKTGTYFSHDLLAKGGAYYVVRLKWNNGTGTAPRLLALSLKRWLQPISVGSNIYTIPGWDADNDSNNDGYVDDSEFAARSNIAASARFRYEARAVPLGSMWNEYSTHCRANLSSNTYREYSGNYYKQTWNENSQSGAYNDDFFRHLGEDSFKVISGGQLAEYNGKVQDAEVISSYVEDFKHTLDTIRTISGSEWLSANISAENLFVNKERLQFVESLDAVGREDYLFPSVGLTGYFGVNKTWDNFALASLGIKSVITAHNQYGRASLQDNTETNWEKDSESELALYYMMNVPNKTYYQAWNKTFNYGSNNTFKGSSSYWKAGVPKNYAYQPSEMLTVDIGQPSNEIQSGKEALKYMATTKTPLSDYTVIGDSTDMVLRHTDIGEAGEVAVIPSYIYYFQRGPKVTWADAPYEMVLARNYTKGLVLYRTDFFGRSADFMATTSELLTLPGTYRRVKNDGRLGEPINTIRLQGYEGAILVK